MWARLYSSESSMDGGTLHQLRNVINRVNVGRGKEIKHQVNEVEDFLELVVNCHLVAAAMHFFGMKSVKDTPHFNGFSDDIKSLELHRKKKVFYERLERIVDEYVVPRQYSQQSNDVVTAASENPHLQRIQHDH